MLINSMSNYIYYVDIFINMYIYSLYICVKGKSQRLNVLFRATDTVSEIIQCL